MADLAHLLAIPEQQDEPWFIEPRDNDPRSEEKRQLAFLRDARIICPSVQIFSVPNAGKRTQWAAAKAKREGMSSGVPDLVCVWSRGVAFIEFKDGKAMPTPNQRDWLNFLYRSGHHCGVFRTSAAALDFLQGCGAPFIVRGMI